ncbi:MAG: AMP-binding protein [Pseudomonadota bacterium]
MSDFDHGIPARPSIGVSALLARTAQVRPRHLATLNGDRHRSWSEVSDRVARMASAIRSMGLEDGDRVAVLALTNDRYFELLAAIPRAGGVVVPLNWRWSIAELADGLADCEPNILFVDDRMLDTAQQLHAGRPALRLISIGESVHGLPHYEALLTEHEPGEDAGRGGDALYQLGYTGGTTGRSKAAMLSHRNVISDAMMCWADGLFSENSRYLLNGPMFHAAGTWPSLSLMGSGGTAILMPQFEPVEALQLIEKHRCTESLLVPAVIQMLIEHPDFPKTDTSSFTTIIYGASPITETLLDRAVSAFPAARFIQAYGMTELSPVCAILPDYALRGEYRARGVYRAAGRAAVGVQIKIVDEDDIEVPRGEVGEIAVRGENMMLGYWRRPEETAFALRGGWMHTGDGGRMDEEGFVYVVDRVKDMIISGGENVYSQEVENALALHHAVRQCAVIGIPSEKWGEAVHAIVRLHDDVDVTAEGLMDHCRELIARYKVPRSIQFWDGEFPLTPANKILKRELRRPFWEDQGRGI